MQEPSRQFTPHRVSASASTNYETISKSDLWKPWISHSLQSQCIISSKHSENPEKSAGSRNWMSTISSPFDGTTLKADIVL